MTDIHEAFATALQLLLQLDPGLLEIVTLSLKISLSAVLLGALTGFPLGAAVALFRFPGRDLVNAGLHAFMGLPPVIAGLVVFLLLSRSGPLGPLGLLYTPAAMVIAQWLLVTPIIAALTCESATEFHRSYDEQLRSLGAGPWRTMTTVLWDGRFNLVSAALAGFGRASAEVGAVLMVGGNIHHLTRVMTTSIALETSKGNLQLALALGIVLMGLSLALNLAVIIVRDRVKQRYA